MQSSPDLAILRPNSQLKSDSPALGSGPSCPTTSGGLSDCLIWAEVPDHSLRVPPRVRKQENGSGGGVR